MKCPGCNTTVADDAAVCPKCDYILDPSLFSTEPPKPKPAAKKPATSTGVNKAVKKPGTGTTGAGKKPVAAGGAPAAGKPAAPKRMMPDAPGRRARTPPEQRAPVED